MKWWIMALAATFGVQAASAVDAPVVQIAREPGGATLSWSPVPGAEGYNVFEVAGGYGAPTLLASLAPDQLAYPVAGSQGFFYVTATGEDLPLPAPLPDEAPADVISVYCDAYASLPGTDFFPWWGQATILTMVDLGGGDMAQKLANFNYQGTQLAAPQDLSLMEYLHVDVWSVDEPVVRIFPISQSTGERFFEMTPAFGEWTSHDIPLSHFTDQGLSLSDIHQIKLDSPAWLFGTFFLDNLYFWKTPTGAGEDATLSDLTVDGATVAGFDSGTLNYDVVLPFGTVDVPTVDAVTTDPLASYVVNDAAGLPGTTSVVVTAADATTTLTYNVDFSVALAVPATGAPAPTADPDSVLSIYSDSYTNLVGTNFNPWWGQNTDVTVDLDVAGNNTLRYEELNYQGTEFPNQDVSTYGYLHVDFWTPNATALDFFLIAPGPIEQPYALPVATGTWVSVDIPLQHYHDLGVPLDDVFQFKVTGGDGATTVVYFDNWYFGGTGEYGGEDPVPTEPAPTPDYGAADVIALFTDAAAYQPNHPVDTWSAVWDAADVSDAQVAGDDVKLYENLVFAGINFEGANAVDASAMTHFRFDFWTPDPTDLPVDFRVKLVDFGGDGYGGGNDTEYELILDASSTPALASQDWVVFDLPLTMWPGMSFGEVSQLIIKSDNGPGSPWINTCYIDNVLFHD